ncbi:Hypothetical protein A7982_05842 [Minicystis rosea]|nr:Hypothetical protein A7982_05842 [Minicystis rosea]
MHLAWIKGGEADVTALDGDRISVLSTIPSAPGSRPDGALAGSGAAVRIKVARCRREGDRFLIEGRLIDVTRETRAELSRLVAPPPA